MTAEIPSYSECYQFIWAFLGDRHTYLFNWLDPSTLAVEKLIAYDPEDGTRTTHYLGRYDVNTLTGDFPLASRITEAIQKDTYFGSVIHGWYRNPEYNHPWKLRTSYVGRVLVANPNPQAGCNYCTCDDCNGGVLHRHSSYFATIKMADGTQMCDVCYNYPPCGAGDDCEEFELTHRCRHRPAMVPYPEPLEVQNYLDFFKVKLEDLPEWADPEIG